VVVPEAISLFASVVLLKAARNVAMIAMMTPSRTREIDPSQLQEVSCPCSQWAAILLPPATAKTARKIKKTRRRIGVPKTTKKAVLLVTYILPMPIPTIKDIHTHETTAVKNVTKKTTASPTTMPLTTGTVRKEAQKVEMFSVLTTIPFLKWVRRRIFIVETNPAGLAHAHLLICRII
jgi:hypothetical protein